MKKNHFQPARATLKTSGGEYIYYRLDFLKEQGIGSVGRLPFSIKILLENALRNCDEVAVCKKDVLALASWDPKGRSQNEIPFKPGRVILQDFTGVPALVDLAAMRSAVKRLGGDPAKINPEVPCDLVIDHSLEVDYAGSLDALEKNMQLEFKRNRERYEFLKWGRQAFRNLRIIPPGVGIIHQVNLEHLSKGVLVREEEGRRVVFPDSLVGTDSHTTMINGLGVLGWGVGGIEAEAVMLGQPITMLLPQVIGFRLDGRPKEGVTATDIVLTITHLLRRKGVVGKFVEFFGDGLDQVSLEDRSVIANMAPEYGATMGFFPVDQETLRFLRATGRTDEEVELVEKYTKAQGLFRGADSRPEFSETISFDLACVEPSLAGPKRPQDLVPLKELKTKFLGLLTAPVEARGFGLRSEALSKPSIPLKESGAALTHGSVVIAAITSCTNTSDPFAMLGAGLLAKRAVEKGLRTRPYVKTSLTPGSRAVAEYLKTAGLLKPLEMLGFHIAGYGCATCIGNSGPLNSEVSEAIQSGNLVAASVLSGNRNFEGRVHPLVKANYLASPQLVVAYALAGTVAIDLEKEPIGTGADGKPVFLKDIWPSDDEVRELSRRTLRPEIFRACYRDIAGSPEWRSLKTNTGDLYPWDAKSTYIQEPPFFASLGKGREAVPPIQGARALVMVGDSVTTDHISPAGSIKPDSPAGRYLLGQGVQKEDFNSYGARRGNHEIMVRGTFANIRLRNLLAPGTEGGLTRLLPEGKVMTIFEASEEYRKRGTPLIVLAGKEYGTGSSRDWAAKGPFLLGVKAVIAESFERIHRSNLVGMGILPLQFKAGDTRETLGLTGEEIFDIDGLNNSLKPLQELTVTAASSHGRKLKFQTILRIDAPVEIDYYYSGGILQSVLKLLSV